MKKSTRGFASMTKEQRTEVARKGGLAVSRNREHMRTIGILGGIHSAMLRANDKYDRENNLGKWEIES